VAILPPGAHEYRKRAARFHELGALALLPRIMALNAWLAPAKAQAPAKLQR